MDDREAQGSFDPSARYLTLARQMLSMGQVGAAVHHLRRLLGSDPNHASGHAMLAQCLVASNRLFAAEHEARAALALEPESPEGHHALAAVHIGNRQLTEAQREFEHCLATAPEDTSAIYGLAQIAWLQGRRADARKELERALALDPEETDVLVALGNWHLEAGQLDEAERHVEAARAVDEEDAGLLVLRGHLALRRGQVQEARDFALWALSDGPANIAALQLMAAIQAHQSVWMGLWWRYSVWMQARGDKGQIVILIVAWLLFRFGTLVSEDLGSAAIAQGVQYAWLALCVDSWVGPGLFARAVQKELDGVRLRHDF